MKDWDANLRKAAAVAKQAAMTPFVSGIVEIFGKDEVLPLAMSHEAAAKLLDIAILCGNSQAAANLAKTFSVRPLRRWCGDGLWFPIWKGIGLRRHDGFPVLSAALLAGANFQDLHVKMCTGVEVLLLLWVALDFDSEDWQQLGHFFSSTPRWPSHDLELGHWFLSRISREIREDGRKYRCISTDRVLNALRSGWRLKFVRGGLYEGNQFPEGDMCCAPGLLDLALLCGNSDCADVLATAGVQLREDCSELLKQVCGGESIELVLCDDAFGDDYPLDLGSAVECKLAAVAAAHGSLKRSFKHEGVKTGVAIYQVLAKKFLPKVGIPLALVHDILVFSMEAPEILDQLDLWEEVRGWTFHMAPKTTSAEHVDNDDAEDLREHSGRLGLCMRYSFDFLSILLFVFCKNCLQFGWQYRFAGVGQSCMLDRSCFRYVATQLSDDTCQFCSSVLELTQH